MKCPVCKKNIPNEALKCPYCKSRTGLLCSHCNTVNPVGEVVCKKCGQELLKICPHCNSVNFPIAKKCRKCGSPLVSAVAMREQKTVENKAKSSNKPKQKNDGLLNLKFMPTLMTSTQGYKVLSEGLCNKEKKIFSITGEKGLGKTTLLRQVMHNLKSYNFEWCIGRCTPVTQLSPGGVIQNMLLNLFNLPDFYLNENDLKKEAMPFFSNELRFLNATEISDFLNFLYNSKDGNYEDIIINKRKTFDILNRVFDAFCNTGHFVFVVDNFDYIDGFSIEFLSNFVKRSNNWKNLKFVVIYNEHKPVSGFFGIENKDLKAYTDIHLAPVSVDEFEHRLKFTGESGTYVSKREQEIIFDKCRGNSAFAEQAVSYCFDCQITDKAFLMPKTFSDLVSERLATLRKINLEAFRLLCGANILGEKLNLALLKEIFGYKDKEFGEYLTYLEKAKFIRRYNEAFFEFSNVYLWETIQKHLLSDKEFEEINVKIGRALSVFELNVNSVMAVIAHNLKENRMAFDVWTKLTRIAAYIGDINLYVISQRQCLALLNEFNENETVNIRYNISERLGKLLTEYDPEEAMEFLPDAIANAKTNNDEVKEIELLGYLAACCKKIGNYYGDVECVDNVLKKMTQPSTELETALIKATKLYSLLRIGNCGEVVNLVDNDILPVLNSYISKPGLNKTIPLGFIYDTWLRVQSALAIALVLQGNDRSFEVLTTLFDTIDKHRIGDVNLICRLKLALAYANTMKGNFVTSREVLADVANRLGVAYGDDENVDDAKAQFTNCYDLIETMNNFLLKNYDGLRENLFEYVMFANNTGDVFSKNVFKAMLGKLFCDNKQAKHAIEIYDEQVTYFANKKLALGALLSWYYIAEATIITESPKNAIEIATKALEIAQNPQINNTFFIVLLRMVIAKAEIEQSDYETAKINLESALLLAKKYNMNDLLSKIYYLYANYYFELGSVESQKQLEFLRGSSTMYDKATDLIVKVTKNTYLREKINVKKEKLMDFCNHHSIPL